MSQSLDPSKSSTSTTNWPYPIRGKDLLWIADADLHIRCSQDSDKADACIRNNVTLEDLQGKEPTDEEFRLYNEERVKE